MKLAVFFHIALMNNYEEINNEIFSQITNSGLLNELDLLSLSIVGERKFRFPYLNDKIKVDFCSKNLLDHEIPNARNLIKYCSKNPDAKVCQIHNAGVGNLSNKYPTYRYLEVYHTICRWKECIKNLETYDATGIEIQMDPSPHFSGSFFWANASYVNKLPPLDLDWFPGGIGRGSKVNSHAVEFFIGRNQTNPNWKGLWSSGLHWIEMDRIIEEKVKPYLDSLPTEEQYWKRIINYARSRHRITPPQTQL